MQRTEWTDDPVAPQNGVDSTAIKQMTPVIGKKKSLYIAPVLSTLVSKQSLDMQKNFS